MARRKPSPGKSADSEGGSGGEGGFRVPGIAMVPVGLIVGWAVAGWPGAVFGGVVGVFLWRSRA